jgi:hypothetical protein
MEFISLTKREGTDLSPQVGLQKHLRTGGHPNWVQIGNWRPGGNVPGNALANKNQLFFYI